MTINDLSPSNQCNFFYVLTRHSLKKDKDSIPFTPQCQFIDFLVIWAHLYELFFYQKYSVDPWAYQAVWEEVIF